MKKYLVSTGASKGTSGFTNYMGGYSDVHFNEKLKSVFEDFPNAVIIDGSDDWYAKIEHSPSTLCNKFHIMPLADFHTGISGISSSGKVIEKEDFIRLKKTCLKLGFDITKTLKCYFG